MIVKLMDGAEFCPSCGQVASKIPNIQARFCLNFSCPKLGNEALDPEVVEEMDEFLDKAIKKTRDQRK